MRNHNVPFCGQTLIVNKTLLGPVTLTLLTISPTNFFIKFIVFMFNIFLKDHTPNNQNQYEMMQNSRHLIRNDFVKFGK